VDLLEEAGIPPPLPFTITSEVRARLASIELAQRQLRYMLAFLGGMVLGGALAFLIGYGDVIREFLKWVLSSTGLAVLLSVLNLSRLSSFECPRCGHQFFGGEDSSWTMLDGQCGTCGLPLRLNDGDADADRAAGAP
jgi:predicted RNA-binding Zn-ribbon protein involved in translation (DUF1610 family)